MTTIKIADCRCKTFSNIRRKSKGLDNAFQLNIHEFLKTHFYGSFYFLHKRGDITSVIIGDKEYYGIIYKIENTVNHKVYIGQTVTKRGFKTRYNFAGEGIERVYKYYIFRRGKGLDYNPHLLSSIEKYGFDAFVVDEVFDIADSQEELNEKEIFYINKFDSYYNGYNHTFGGEGFSGVKPLCGADNGSSVKVCQISPDGELIKIWDCIADATRSLGLKRAHISSVCLNKRKTAAGYVWVYEKDYDPNKDYKCKPRKKDLGRGTKPVVLLSDDNEILEEYYSVNYAGTCLGISGQEVSTICKHIAKTPKFNLKFKSEYLEEQRLNEKESYDNAS